MFLMHLTCRAKATYFWVRGIGLRGLGLFISKSVQPPDSGAIKRVLIIRLDRIGDMVVTTALTRALRDIFPLARIFVLCAPLTRALWAQQPEIDEVLTNQHPSRLRQQGFDVVIDALMDQGLKSAWLAYRVGAPYRVGFDIARRGVFFNMPLLPLPHASVARQTLSLVRPFKEGLEDVYQPALAVSVGVRQRVEKILAGLGVASDDHVVLMHPGGSYPSQRWLPERFAQVADYLTKRYGVKVVILGADSEEALLERIRASAQTVLVLWKGYPVEYWPAVMQRGLCLICNNSGALHMAAAVKVPTVSTMGPTDAQRWWPTGARQYVIRKDLSCLGCLQGTCPLGTHDCMRLITVEEVARAVETVVDLSALTGEAR